MPLTVNIFSPAYDPLGYISVVLAKDDGIRDVGRRVQVVPTLDGSVAVDDAGATDSDRSFNLSIRPKDVLQAQQIQYLTMTHPQLRLAMHDGCYQVVPLSVSFVGVECTWNLRVVARLA